MNRKLTEEMLAYIRAVEEARAALPTRRQLANELGVSKSLIDQLANKFSLVAAFPSGPSDYSKLSTEDRAKQIARNIANTAQLRGQLIKQLCEKCDASKVEKHHDDYSKPLAVRWLCKRCHLAEHKTATPLQVIETATILQHEPCVELGLAKP